MENKEQNSILVNYEREANEHAAKIMLITEVIFTLVLVLNILGIFRAKYSVMIPCYILVTLSLTIPIILIKKLKNEQSYMKYIIVSCALVFVTVVSITLAYYTILVYIYAIAISSMYFSKKINIFSIVATTVLVSIGQIICYVFNIMADMNFESFYDCVIFGILPRGLCLIAISLILYKLNNRTSKLITSVINVEEHMVEIKNESLDVSKSLENSIVTLKESSNMSLKVNEKIVSNANDVTVGSSNTLNNIDNALSETSDINTNIEVLSKECSDVSNISNTVKNLTDKNLDIMENAIKEINNINESTLKSKKIINELDEKSKMIIQIVEVITEISSETNLLALNAAIESARAGEAGKGFAVVADEIRNLASQTQDAVSNIGEIINEVVSRTKESVETMDSNSELTVKGVEIINKAKESSLEIARESDNMNSKIEKINTKTCAVLDGSERICDIINEIKDISTSNVNELKNVLSESEKGRDSVEQLTSLVDSIREMSQKLKKVME